MVRESNVQRAFAISGSRGPLLALTSVVLVLVVSGNLARCSTVQISYNPVEDPHYTGPCTAAKLIAAAGTTLTTPPPSYVPPNIAELTKNDLRPEEAICDDRGLYAVLQCSRRTAACWCVHPQSNDKLTVPVSGRQAIEQLPCWKHVDRSRATWSVTIQPNLT